MKIYYDSLTGNVKRFSNKLDYHCYLISDEIITNEQYVLITYTTNFGEVPYTTKEFIKNNPNIICIISSGNRNWGNNFARSADVIRKKFNLRWWYKFELSGSDKDVDFVNNLIKKLEEI